MGLAVKEKYMVKRLFEDINIMRRLLSSANISAIEQNIQVKLNLRGNQAMIEGDKLDVDLVDNLLEIGRAHV